MRIGQYQLRTVSGGHFRTDGGSLFGVVPKKLWSRQIAVDEHNQIAQRTNCLLLRSEQETLLIDTGYGSYLPEKQRAYMHAEDGNPLFASLHQAGVEPTDVDTVILTHLHYDHVGGALVRDSSDELVPAFDRARYIVQREEWRLATSGAREIQAAYHIEQLAPLNASGRLELIDGETEVAAGIRCLPTPGHTMGHQSVLIEGGEQSAVYLGDLCATTRHLRTGWCMAFDTHLLEVRRQKRHMLERIADNNWWALFDHDPDTAAARIRRCEQREFVIEDRLSSLS